MSVVFKDRIVEYPSRYNMQQNSDGTITLIPAPGVIVEQGTPLNAGNLNSLSSKDELEKLASSKGQPNGIATLNSLGKIPLSQIPYNIKNIYSFSGINYSITVENIDFKNNILTEIYVSFRSGVYREGILKINEVELINISKTTSTDVKNYCIAKIIVDKDGNYRVGYSTSSGSTVYFETAHNELMMRDKKGKLALVDNNILSLVSDENTRLEVFAYGGE